MYLCDKDLRALLPELDFRAEACADVFAEADQVQPGQLTCVSARFSGDR